MKFLLKLKSQKI